MQSAKRTVILTGTNRGIGKKTAEILLQKYSEQFSFVFTQRQKNHEDLKNHFQSINKNAQFEIKQLDIGNKESRTKFFEWYSSQNTTLDVLFNNAGVYDKIADNGKRPSHELAKNTLGINFISQVELTEEFFPLLSKDAKIIQMTGILGKLSFQPKHAQEILKDQTITKERLFNLAQDYINSTQDSSKDLIFSNYTYHTSKALLNTYIRFVASSYIKPKQSVFAVHPGWVQTDMGGSEAPMTVSQACPYLANIIGEYPFERHALSGCHQFKNKSFGY